MKFQPKSLADFAFSHDETYTTLDDISQGIRPFPGDNRGLLFYGPPGTGKTALSQWLPQFWESCPGFGQTAYGGNGVVTNQYVHFQVCNAATTIAQVTTAVKQRVVVNLSPVKGFRYEIFDEAGLMTPNVLAALAGTMTDPQLYYVIFILTANQLSQIPTTISQSRCLPLPMARCQPDALVPLGQRILTQLGLPASAIPVNALIAMATTAKGDLRRYLPDVETAARRLLAGGAPRVAVAPLVAASAVAAPAVVTPVASSMPLPLAVPPRVGP